MMKNKALKLSITSFALTVIFFISLVLFYKNESDLLFVLILLVVIFTTLSGVLGIIYSIKSLKEKEITRCVFFIFLFTNLLFPFIFIALILINITDLITSILI